jgi:signal-transduction protein with cAMP-binding, CBS, and nucleotidyltransferase domain
MEQSGYHAFVVDRRHEQDAYGIVTAADIVYKIAALGKDPDRVRVYEIMTKPCIVVNPDLGVEYVARLFAEHGLSRAPVIQKELLGLISLSDIVVKGLTQLPSSPSLESTIAAAIAEAKAICAEQGATSLACRNAWDQVDRMQAELAHQRQEHLEKTAFESFVEEYPEVLESSLYETWCSG